MTLEITMGKTETLDMSRIRAEALTGEFLAKEKTVAQGILIKMVTPANRNDVIKIFIG